MYSLKTLNIAHQLLVNLKASLNFYVNQKNMHVATWTVINHRIVMQLKVCII